MRNFLGPKHLPTYQFAVLDSQQVLQQAVQNVKAYNIKSE